MVGNVLRAPKKKKRKRSKKKAARVSTEKLILAAGFSVAVLLLAFMAFISAQGAVAATGFLAFSALIYYENKRRSFWERSFNYKLKTLSDGQEELNREAACNRHDIAALKEGLYSMAQGIDEQEQPETLAERLIAVARRPRASSAPRAAKQSPAPAAAQQSTNHDDGLSDTVIQELTHNAVRNNKIEVFMQPIVRLPQRQARFYEVFARIRANPGTYIPASRYMNVANEDGLMHSIDQLLLMQCLKTIQKTAHLEKATPFFLNITTKTLANKAFMNVLLNFLAKNRALAPRLIFEIQQRDFENMRPAILEILRGLGRLGCALSIDHVTNLEFDIKFLQILKVRYVKINATQLYEMTKNEKSLGDLWRLKRRLEGNGIGFIVEKIESEAVLRNLLDIDLNYGQGFLFGRPDLQGAYRSRKRIKRTAA